MKLDEQMRQTLARWQESGLSLRGFGEREKISYSKLVYWRRKLLDGKKRKPRAASTTSFAPVRVVADEADARANPEVVEVWLANGVSLSVPIGMDGGELRRLIGVLSSC